MSLISHSACIDHTLEPPRRIQHPGDPQFAIGLVPGIEAPALDHVLGILFHDLFDLFHVHVHFFVFVVLRFALRAWWLCICIRGLSPLALVFGFGLDLESA